MKIEDSITIPMKELNFLKNYFLSVTVTIAMSLAGGVFLQTKENATIRNEFRQGDEKISERVDSKLSTIQAKQETITNDIATMKEALKFIQKRIEYAKD